VRRPDGRDRHWSARLRGVEPEDAALIGAWTPDPAEPDFPVIMSYVFDHGWMWSLWMASNTLRRSPQEYRVVGPGRLALGRFGNGGLWSYRFEGPDVLHHGRYRFLPTSDPEDRVWPNDGCGGRAL